jgi:CHAT domain-containing protein
MHLEALGDTAFPVINAFNDYGAIQYYYLGNADKRIELLERAAKAIEKMASMEGVAMGRLERDLQITFHNLAAVYAQLGDFEAAIRVYRRVIALKEQLPNPEPVYLAPSYAELGKVYVEMAQWDEAQRWYEKALNIIPKTDPAFVKRAPEYLHFLAKIQYALGNLDQALANIRFAKTLAPRALEAENEALTGAIFFQQEKINQAIPFFERALRMALEQPAGKQKLIAELYEQLANCNFKQGNFAAVIPRLNAGLVFLSGKEVPVDDLFFLPEKDAVHFPFEVIRLLERKVALLHTMSDTANLAEQQAIQDYSSRAYALALALCQAQIATFKKDDSKLFWVDKMSGLVHRQVALQAAIFQKNQNEKALAKAFEAAETLKAGVLREAVADARALSSISLPDNLEGRLGALKLSCAKLRRKLAASPGDSSLQQQLFVAERGLELANDSLFDLLKNSSIGLGIQAQHSLKDAQQLLDPGTQLIQYVRSEEQLVVFSIQKEKADLFVVNDIAGILENISLLHKQLKNPDIGNTASLSAACSGLYRQLLQPLGSLKPSLIIVPDGPLFQIPFAALINGETHALPLSEWPWLVKQHSIRYSASSAFLATDVRVDKQVKENWLGVAPVRFGNGLQPLPLSQGELEIVGKALGEKGHVLEGSSASKTAFMTALDDHQAIIHLSTHAASNGNYPENSWLAFAGEGDTARMYLDELYGLPLRTRLLVLSACETQAGKLSRGEGIMSLARAFRYAGAQAVMATLWPSDELASSLVMEQFYTRLAEGLPQDEALRLAQQHYLYEANLPEDKMHPAYWAPFVFTGDMNPLGLKPAIDWYWYPLCVLGFGLLAWLFYTKFKKR